MKILLMTVLLLVSVSAVAAIAPQNIVRGQTATVETDYEIGNAAIGDQTVCDYLIQSNRREIYLNARKAGTTTLTLWDTQGTRRDAVPISVSSQDMGALQQEAQQLFGSGTKLKLSRSGDQVLIEGEAGSAAEAEKIESYIQRNPTVRSTARLTPEAQGALARKIETAIEIPGIHVRAVQGRLMMEGLAYSAEAASRAEKIAKLFDPGIMNLIEVKETKRRPGKEPMVVLDVYFMEVKKSAIRTLGISWTPGGTPSGGMSGSGGMFGNLIGSAVGTVFNLLPKIRWVHESGNGRILEQPSLIVKSGDAGEFFSGTQVPYYSAQNVQFKEVGIKLSAEPISSGGAVDLKISATLSTLSAGVNQGIDTHTVNTVAYCKAGESLVLANLYRNGDSKTWNRLPQGIDTSSALFTLVASRDFQSHTTDLVIFVTPRVVEAGDSAAPAMARFQELDEKITKKRSKREWREKFHDTAEGPVTEGLSPHSHGLPGRTADLGTGARFGDSPSVPPSVDSKSVAPYAIELPTALQPTGGKP